TGDRRDVTDEIEIQLVVERRVDRLCRTDREQRVAVRGCAHDGFGGDISAGARPVLNDEWLAEPLGQPLTDQARRDVAGTAGGEADNNARRAGRIGLRPRYARYSRQCGSAGGEMPELAAGKFHGEPPFTSFDHLVGAQHERGWNLEADRLRGLQVDRQLEPRRLLDRDVTDLLAAKDFGQLARQLPEHLGDARTIADQSTLLGELRRLVHGR